jgi:diacylglycerol kinase
MSEIHENLQKQRRGIDRVIHAFGYSLQGLQAGMHLSKHCKDLGSAAVLLSILVCMGIWLSALIIKFSQHI